MKISQLACLLGFVIRLSNAANVTFTNPILPGFNPDPSCTFVKEWDNTFFCTTSSFLTFPSIPLFASKDLVHWKHASYAISRGDQLPELYRNSALQTEGTWASTLRYRDGTFYLITSYVSWHDGWGPIILLFTTTDPYDDAAWSGPVRFENPEKEIDPDLFWDDDGKFYMSVARGIFIHQVDISTGKVLETFTVWNGTDDRNPEGPHIYNKDGYYYLGIGEGGTETNHSAVIARSTSISGPYEGYERNPMLTAKNTDAFFQTVGHTDFFQDAEGNWWCVALATRSGPAWEIYPMGRETVLSPMTWDEGGWPIIDPIQGTMSGPLPPKNTDLPGDGFWAHEGDEEDFRPGTQIPKQFLFWRPPKESLFNISPTGHPNSLQVSPSRVNLTADSQFEPREEGMGYISRKQSSSVFQFTVDLEFDPKDADEEAGATVFLTQYQHIDVSVVNTRSCSTGELEKKFRFRPEALGKPGVEVPPTRTITVPQAWAEKHIRFTITLDESQTYNFTVAPVDKPDDEIWMGSANADIVSGGSGPFHGTLLGVFATSNGGTGKTAAYFSRWRYHPLKQEIESGVFLPIKE
ncbi:hypothetical protein V2G26_001977 [Clonostachys chloroleuca]